MIREHGRGHRKLSKVRLIVHADDFGLTERINDGVLQAHLNGILTSTSIMPNGRAFEHAVATARLTPTLDVGIHLTLIEERPLLESGTIATLTTRDGKFHGHALGFIRRYVQGRISLTEITKELETQIQKVLAAGISPSHLDSHQHVHMLPGVLNIVVELSRQYGIPAIRFPREVGVFRQIGSAPLARLIQALALNCVCHLGRDRIGCRTDFFAGFLFGGNLNKENLLKILTALHYDGTYEIVCHPGLDDPGTQYGHWGYHWLDELNALLDADIADFLQQRRIELISYRQLHAA